MAIKPLPLIAGLLGFLIIALEIAAAISKKWYTASTDGALAGFEV